MTSCPVICFTLRDKEHISQKNPDSPGGRGSDESLTALSVGPATLHLQDIDLGRDDTGDLQPGTPFCVHMHGRD